MPQAPRRNLGLPGDVRRYSIGAAFRRSAMCHAIGRSGTSPHAVAPPFRSLAQRYPIESLEESLGEGLLSGHPDMPEFSFPPRDVGAIIRYLRSIQQR